MEGAAYLSMHVANLAGKHLSFILLAGQASNRLVRPHMHAAACSAAPELRSGLRGLSDGAAATLDALLDLSDALLDRIPDCAAADADAAPAAPVGKKRSRAGAAEDDSAPGERMFHAFTQATYCKSTAEEDSQR